MKKLSVLFAVALLVFAGNSLAQGTQISGSQIKDGAITNSKIANGAISGSKFTLGIITNEHVAANAAIDWTKISKVGALPADISAEHVLTFNSPLVRSSNAISISNIAYTLVNFTGATPSLIGAENPLTFDTPLTRVTNTISCATFVASGDTHAPGCVPDPGATPGTSKFLREDSQFVEPVTEATTVDVTNDTALDADVHPIWVANAATGQTVKASSGNLTYHPSTQVLTNGGTTVSGNLVLNDPKLTTGTLASVNGIVSTIVTKYTWNNANVVACGSNLTCDITAGTIPANYIVKRVLMVVLNPAANIGTLTVSLGITAASYDDYILASDIKASANTIYGDLLAELGASMQDYLGNIPSLTGATALKIHLIATDGGANTLADVTGSSGVIFIETMKLPF